MIVVAFGVRDWDRVRDRVNTDLALFVAESADDKLGQACVEEVPILEMLQIGQGRHLEALCVDTQL